MGEGWVRILMASTENELQQGVNYPLAGKTINQILDELSVIYPDISFLLCEQRYALRVIINDRLELDFNKPLPEGAKMIIFPAICGG